MLSILDIFRIGIGPSSSHTVGPMRIAARFIRRLLSEGCIADVDRIEVRLLGSLAFTGEGHATPKAIILGLMGMEPETLDPAVADEAEKHLRATQTLDLDEDKSIPFDPDADIILDYETPPDLHPNAIICIALDKRGAELCKRRYYSPEVGSSPRTINLLSH